MLWIFLVTLKTPGLGLGTSYDVRSVRFSNSNVVSVQCGKQHTIPGQVDTNSSSKPDESMSHQGDSTTLRGTAEEGNLGLVLAKQLGKEHGGIPSRSTAGILVVLDRVELHTEARVSLDDTSPANLEKRNE